MENLGFDLRIIVAYLVNFAILLVILRMVAYKPVLAMLERRRQEISDGLAAADKVRAEAEEEREKFEGELTAVKQSSQEEASRIAKVTEGMREKILADARQEAEAIKTKARADIEAERQALQAEVQRQVADLTVVLTRKIVSQSINETQHRELVDKFLAEMGD